MKTPIRLVGFSKKKNIEVTLLLYDDKERGNSPGAYKEKDTVKDAYYFFEPDTLIQCREFNSGILLDELELKDLFNKPKL